MSIPRTLPIRSAILFFVLAAGLFAQRSAQAVPIEINYSDGDGFGFNDPNFGELRRTAFEAAVSAWSRKISGNVPLTVDASFNSFGTTDGNVNLGYGLPSEFFERFAPGGLGITNYPDALISELSGRDQDPGLPMMYCQFSSDLDDSTFELGESWYYGLDGNPPDFEIDFFTNAMHQIGQGLGFYSLINQDGTYHFQDGTPSIYDQLLAAGPTAGAPLLSSMTNSERAAAVVSGSLYSTGSNTRFVTNGLGAAMYAPGFWDSNFGVDISVGSLDQSTYATPPLGDATSLNNALMVPNYAGPIHDPGSITLAILQDMGWSTNNFTIAGTISQSNGQLVAGVTVLAEGSNQSAVTDSNGNYVITGLATGTYQVTPQRSGFTFSPSSDLVTVGPSTSNVNFTAQPPVTITLLTPPANSSVSQTTTVTANTSVTDNAVVSQVAYSHSTPPINFTRSVNGAIPDVGEFDDTESIASQGVVESATVTVNITHQYIGDLEVLLVAPDGKTTITLDNHVGGNGTGINTTYNIASTPAIALLAGQPAGGNWELRVIDSVPVDTGTLVSWGMNITSWVPLGPPVTVPKVVSNTGTLAWPFSWDTSTTPTGTYTVRAQAVCNFGTFTAVNPGVTVTLIQYTIGGTVTTSAGTGLANIPLTLQSASGTAVLQTVKTNSTGAYSFTKLSSGTYIVTPKPATTTLGYTLGFNVANKTVQIAATNATGISFKQNPAYTLAGIVTISPKVPLAGVEIQLSGSNVPVRTTTTGAYSFAGLPSQSYVVTPSLPGYKFQPATLPVKLTGNNSTANFTAIPALTISGKITTAAGVPVTGTSVAIKSTTAGTIAPVITDNNGVFTFSGLKAGIYTLTPSKTGLAFKAVGANPVTLVATSITTDNFTALTTYSISGLVRTSAGLPLAGVAISGSGGLATTLTGENGVYTIAGVTPGKYSLTATLPDFKFLAIAETVVATNLVGANFTGTLVQETITGTIRNSSGAALPGVTMQCTGQTSVTTLANGTYSFTVPPSGSYTITPSLANYVFTGAGGTPSTVVAVANTNVTGVNFAGKLVQKITISGTVRNSSGAAMSGVTMQCTGLASVLTLANGTYTLTAPAAGTYTITPSLSGFVFVDGDGNGNSTGNSSLTVTVAKTNVTGVDFTGDVAPPDPFSASLFSSFSKSAAPAGILSTASANSANGTVQLAFLNALDATANDLSHYAIQVDGVTVAPASSSYLTASHTVVLGLPAGVLTPRAQVLIAWSQLSTAAGISLPNGAISVNAR